MRRTLIAAASLIAVTSSAASAQSVPDRPTQEAAQSGKPAWGTFGVDFASMDRSVRPGDDFWSFVNGTWAKTAVIPPDRGALSQVQRLNDLAASQVRAIIEEMIARRPSLSGDEARVADYYAALMDRAAIDARGAEPLLAELAPVRAAGSHSALAAEMGRLLRRWRPTPPIGRMPRYFPSLFPLAGRTTRIPSATSPVWGKAASACPTATIISAPTKRRGRRRTPTARTSPTS